MKNISKIDAMLFIILTPLLILALHWLWKEWTLFYLPLVPTITGGGAGMLFHNKAKFKGVWAACFIAGILSFIYSVFYWSP